MKKRLKIVLYIIFFANLAAAFLYYSYYFYHIKRSNRITENLEKTVLQSKIARLHQIAEAKIARAKSKENRTEDEEETSIDITKLQKTNRDIYAWIDIPNSSISYPVLQHSKKDLYYLYHNIDGSLGYPGCIFSERVNGKDFKDAITVLYGHNMKNGTMFGDLKRFQEKQYFQEHKYIYIYRKDEVLVYIIVAAVQWSDKSLKTCYDYGTDQDASDFLNAVNSMKNGQHRIEKVTDSKRILILSTCSAKRADKRFLVAAVQIGKE